MLWAQKANTLGGRSDGPLTFQCSQDFLTAYMLFLYDPTFTHPGTAPA